MDSLIWPVVDPPYGILADALAQLREDSSACYDWYDDDLVERLTSEGMDTIAQQIYDEGLGDLIADSTGYINPHMG